MKKNPSTSQYMFEGFFLVTMDLSIGIIAYVVVVCNINVMQICSRIKINTKEKSCRI